MLWSINVQHTLSNLLTLWNIQVMS